MDDGPRKDRAALLLDANFLKLVRQPTTLALRPDEQRSQVHMKRVALLGSPRSTGNRSTIAKHLAESAVKLGAQSKIYELIGSLTWAARGVILA